MESRAAKHGLVFIFVTVLIDTMGFGIILPVTPELIMELTGKGLSDAAIYGGWLAFAYAVMQFFCGPIIGNLSDHFGRRPVLLLSLFAFAFDYTLMGLAPTLAWLFLGRAMAGVAGAAHTTAGAYIADISPPEKRAQNFGILGAGFGLGFILGPALGGMLAQFGSRAPFFASAALALINMAYGYFVLPESLAPESRRPFSWKRANTLGTLVQMRKYPSLPALFVALFLWQLAHQVLPNTWAFYTMLKFGWSETAVGYSLAFVGVTMAVVQGGLTRVLIPRLGERRGVLLGYTVGAIGFLGYAFSDQGWQVYGWMTFAALMGLAYPSMSAIMSQHVPASAQGELQGGIASLFSLSSIIGPLVMTQLFGYFTSDSAPIYFPGAAFVFAAMLVCGSLMLFLRADATDVAREPTKVV